ncbi:plastid ribosomal protein L3 [Chloropicon primus]|uniref:Large ribosomal subunit protein uL3c n=1 Tax=Chloropicon primus TaxID=1764295 RepID=A0A5B8MPR2_9CHLO|nr:plastid ribosomal protein L3 [Chloropicon primus]UPR00796.1 plastid ribosomal protein L3 [Chloropicon primus]|eukprot:QDZ21585.1 plastid ribosomal protein L3 [Chloropicon primus]
MERTMARSFVGRAVGSGGARVGARRAQRGRLQVQARAMERGVGLMGTKAGMTSVFSEDGKMTPVTVIGLKDGGCYVTQIKTKETDGYNAVQVGYDVKRETLLTKPELGHLKKNDCPPLRHLTEFKLESIPEGLEVGSELDPTEMFSVGDKVDVAGRSVGKGFAGGIKRHGFSRGLMSHGSKSHREHGTTGPGSTPSRVYPGTKHPGQMGDKRAKVKKLEVMQVEKDMIVVKGSIPGKPGNMMTITKAKGKW